MPTEALLMSRIPCHADTPACQARSLRPPKRKPHRRGQSDNAPTLDWPDHQPRQRRFGIGHIGIVQDQHGDIDACGTCIKICRRSGCKGLGFRWSRQSVAPAGANSRLRNPIINTPSRVSAPPNQKRAPSTSPQSSTPNIMPKIGAKSVRGVVIDTS